MIIAIFFTGHWFSSLFMQSFFLHRYSAHRMFSMSIFWERFFFIMTFITQGTSYLNAKAYAVMHRMHHAYSDTERDPHSPHFFRSVFAMMLRTKTIYYALLTSKMKPGDRFEGNTPEWRRFEIFADHMVTRISFAAVYVLIYFLFAPYWWLFFLLPVHFLMGPIHGAIVNWCGHKYGYRNFKETRDYSRNTLPFDFLTMGELFQNNHHKYPSRVNFGVRFFEIDPAYSFIKMLHWLRIIRLAPVHHD